MTSKVRFLSHVLYGHLAARQRDCPFCGSLRTVTIGKKHLILELRRCADCGLMFRWPKDTAELNRWFYEFAYREGMTTDLPDEQDLLTLKQGVFAGTDKDFSEKIELLRVAVPGGRVLDYGCSWGYGTFQLMSAGYDVIGLEISRRRAEFGRTRLGLNIVNGLEAIAEMRGSFDAIFASHVLEHLPALHGIFEQFTSLLRPAGSLIAFVPNGGGRNALRLGPKWGPMCCEKHPLAFDSAFFTRVLPKYGFAVKTFTEPYRASAISGSTTGPGDLMGDELMVWARKIDVEPANRPAARPV
jgi:2-polyprenyl-3-methyl-5-hydroxy-6-metoxy-1,4-benzoquinol methylase